MLNESSILKHIRESLGLTEDNGEFDVELLNHINSSIMTLNQNGVGNFIMVNDVETTWNDLLDPLQTEGNKYWGMIPLYIALNTKVLFDPPPPSSVKVHQRTIDELLWRLRVAFEETEVDNGQKDTTPRS